MNDINTQDTESSVTGKSAMNKAQKKFAIGAMVIVLAIGYMIYSAIDTSANYYYTVCEAKSMGNSAKGISLRLEGKVSPGTINNDAANLTLSFEIMEDPEKNSDCSKTMPVYYKGVAPDLMQDEINVVVEGQIDNSGKFIADRVLTSCPSRYDAAEELKKES